MSYSLIGFIVFYILSAVSQVINHLTFKNEVGYFFGFLFISEIIAGLVTLFNNGAHHVGFLWLIIIHQSAEALLIGTGTVTQKNVRQIIFRAILVAWAIGILA